MTLTGCQLGLCQRHYLLLTRVFSIPLLITVVFSRRQTPSSFAGQMAKKNFRRKVYPIWDEPARRLRLMPLLRPRSSLDRPHHPELDIASQIRYEAVIRLQCRGQRLERPSSTHRPTQVHGRTGADAAPCVLSHGEAGTPHFGSRTHPGRRELAIRRRSAPRLSQPRRNRRRCRRSHIRHRQGSISLLI